MGPVTSVSDQELLLRYLRDRDEGAFTSLVRRHVNLVYSAALRQVRCRLLAEEVAQSAFVDLARNAVKLSASTSEAPVLAAWLYQVTRRTAVDVVRRESRRQAREQIAMEMTPMNTNSAHPDPQEADWTQIEPILDDAMGELGETDRTAILLRYFENKSLREVGAALGMSDDAAQKRVGRAVDRLRGSFAKRGVTVGAGGFAIISANAAQGSPAGLTASICAAVKVSTATATATTTTIATLIRSMATTTTQKAALAAIIAMAAGFSIYQIRKEPAATLAGNPENSASPVVTETVATHSPANRRPVKGGPLSLLQPRLDEAGKRHLQQDPGAVLSAHAVGDGEAWSRADDNLLVAWAAADPDAALKWIDGGERSVVRGQLFGAVAAGILLRDGKDAMRRFLDQHQQDPQLRPKDQGQLESFLFYHLGREDTFGAAMDLLRENKDTSLAGSMILGIDGAHYKTNAIDYLEAKGIPVEMNYWSHQDAIEQDPQFWADWARQRDSDLLEDIVDGWARDHPAEAKAWLEKHVPKGDKRRADIDERLRVREEPIE